MRFTLILHEDEHLICGACGEMQGDHDTGNEVFIGDPEEQNFVVLCRTCLDLEEACIANGQEFTGVTNPENPPEVKP